MKNGVQLITYADSMGGNIDSLHSILKKHFDGCFSGIHILPFYPSTGDRGFSPLTYSEIDPDYGDWEDLTSLGTEYEILADFMVNHISRNSTYFQDWIRMGEKSEYNRLFLPVERIFPPDGPTTVESEKIYRRQDGDPWLTVKFDSGNEQRVWCTFSEDQIDIDIASPAGLELFTETAVRLKSAGIKMIRLDAVGYITKKRGTSCFMVEPDIWNTLVLLKNIASPLGIELLPEMHEHYIIQQKMASKGFPVYDFALPLLLLYSLYSKDFSPLKNWLKICPGNQFTTLDTHDGIGVVDAADLLSAEQTDYTVEKLFSKGSNIKKKYSTSEYQNLDIYQINCTYFSALGEDDDAYLSARAIQFFTPGIPQVYYVGLLAGRNDLELVEKTKQGRDINRHNYTGIEIENEISRAVVERLKKLLRFRMTCSAFDGDFSIEDSVSSILKLHWKGISESASLTVDLENTILNISVENMDSGKVYSFSP